LDQSYPIIEIFWDPYKKENKDHKLYYLGWSILATKESEEKNKVEKLWR
jgi:hypothetical protein